MLTGVHLCTHLPQLPRTPVYTAKLSLLNVYLFLVIIYLLFIFFLSLHLWEGPVNKHFTLTLHPLF